MIDKYFILFSHNVVVSGKEKSAIYDLQHANIIYIPNIFIMVIEKLKTKTVQKVKEEMFTVNPEILDQYLQKLSENNMGMFLSNPSVFPELDFSFYVPCVINSAVLEVDMEEYDIISVINKLDSLGCRHIEIRIKCSAKYFEKLKKALEIWNTNLLQSLDIFWEFNDDVTIEIVNKLYNFCPKINNIIVHGSPNNEFINKEIRFCKMTLRELEIEGINNNKLILDVKYYSESLKYNTTYHNKVAIDFNGNIKNIIFDNNIYGNVNQVDLIDVVNTKEFQKYWEITPDKIEQLKESPLRYASYNPFPIYYKQGKYYIENQL